jgi:hypothetical protein
MGPLEALHALVGSLARSCTCLSPICGIPSTMPLCGRSCSTSHACNPSQRFGACIIFCKVPWWVVGQLCIGLGVPDASCPRQLACTLVPFPSRPLPWVGEGVAPSCWQMASSLVPRPTAPMPPRHWGAARMVATPMSLWVPPSAFAWHGAPGMLLPWAPTALQVPVSQFPLALSRSKDLWSELLADVGASSLMPPWPKIWKKQHPGT